MSQPLHIIYIPGLGDVPGSRSLRFQAWTVRHWRRLGVESELIPMDWAGNETWQDKLDRVLLRIDTMHAQGKRVGLVCSSAGALVAVNAFAARQTEVVGVVAIAGKINRPEAIGDRYASTNPALLPAAYACELALARLKPKARRRIQSRYALIDETVSRADSHVPGARNRRLIAVGHVVTIATQLVFGAPSFVRFLQRRT